MELFCGAGGRKGERGGEAMVASVVIIMEEEEEEEPVESIAAARHVQVHHRWPWLTNQYCGDILSSSQPWHRLALGWDSLLLLIHNVVSISPSFWQLASYRLFDYD